MASSLVGHDLLDDASDEDYSPNAEESDDAPPVKRQRLQDELRGMVDVAAENIDASAGEEDDDDVDSENEEDRAFIVSGAGDDDERQQLRREIRRGNDDAMHMELDQKRDRAEMEAMNRRFAAKYGTEEDVVLSIDELGEGEEDEFDYAGDYDDQDVMPTASDPPLFFVPCRVCTARVLFLSPHILPCVTERGDEVSHDSSAQADEPTTQFT